MQSSLSAANFAQNVKKMALLVFAIFPVLSAFSIEAWASPAERIHFNEIDSTQTFAKDHAKDFLDAPGKWVVVTADRQTKGLGHQGRKWESSSNGNLYATFVTLYPKNKKEELFHVIQISALSVAKTLQEFHLDPGIKWVNDVFLSGKKISGCLCEIIPSPLSDHYYLLIGIGINVNMMPDKLALVSTPATSMYAEMLETVDKEAVLRILTGHVQESLEILLRKDYSLFYEEINRLLVFKGRLVEVEIEPKSVVRGRIIGLDEDGSLLLAMPGDEILKTLTGRILKVFDEES